jgi:hypothetical protein
MLKYSSAKNIKEQKKCEEKKIPKVRNLFLELHGNEVPGFSLVLIIFPCVQYFYNLETSKGKTKQIKYPKDKWVLSR